MHWLQSGCLRPKHKRQQVPPQYRHFRGASHFLHFVPQPLSQTKVAALRSSAASFAVMPQSGHWKGAADGGTDDRGMGVRLGSTAPTRRRDAHSDVRALPVET
eukprot:CAMPEP_0183327260 /NCGR_PEP_ID=MMETSP0160_2-20130417/83675_1 /TAXON_ID=2839 ORGANISM="Odontella Sinensis, Strain Grunow 1884" /NCGR_SAMPLE_ID=MMETSP0160_2 /ASSEMBLY_ACC=CAM_ASM_000250 /LENGTH=102 /DNA_ID=CAMNT_0025495385 /DNA_START=784 /DNA_END=1089 /DNA_ORIENTATION=-